MKLKYILYLFFITAISHSQNLLKNLYDIDTNFPPKMEKSKAFIEQICSDLLIYNLIPGGNNSHHSSYQFEIKSKNNLKFNLPFTDSFSIEFFDYKTKQPVKEHLFYVNYYFQYLSYNHEFDLNEETFSPYTYFTLATEINNYTETDIVREILYNLYKDPFDNRYSLVINEINKQVNSNLKLSLDEVLNEDEPLTMNEKIENLTNALYDHFDEDLMPILFKTFFKDKSDEKSLENIKKFFNDNIIEQVDNVLQPKIEINTNQSAFLNIPNKYISVASEELHYLVNNIETILDFKNKCLILNLKNNSLTKLILKQATLVENDKTVNNIEITSKNIQIKITETNTKLYIEDTFSKKKYEIILKK